MPGWPIDKRGSATTHGTFSTNQQGDALKDTQQTCRIKLIYRNRIWKSAWIHHLSRRLLRRLPPLVCLLPPVRKLQAHSHAFAQTSNKLKRSLQSNILKANIDLDEPTNFIDAGDTVAEHARSAGRDSTSSRLRSRVVKIHYLPRISGIISRSYKRTPKHTVP